eukprot:TRINITY_DN4579_c0_g1_i1.p1 TRINITY_DN4579_c0_g1~~TRINITY_DN4579_c0_g1_i1.p1  ORF type:complete len:728 (+),score=156.38 TRINITY_DN4579_c0_g1_i1:302-2185(+)
MEAFSSLREELHVRRESNKYSYTFDLIFRSRCDGDQSSKMTVTAEFMAPCSMVTWHRQMEAKPYGFVVSADPASEHVRITVINPEAPERLWKDDNRLERVELKYRRKGTSNWLALRGPDHEAFDLKGNETLGGAAVAAWPADSLLDGEYELLAQTHCQAVSLDDREGVNSARSVVITGLVDREKPRRFGTPEPHDGVFSTGDHVAVQFTEVIDCSQLWRLKVEVDIGKYIRLRNKDLDIICEGHGIELSVFKTIAPASVTGQPVNVTVARVFDFAGNELDVPVRWSFNFEADKQAVASPTVVEGIRFDIPYAEAWDNHTSEGYIQFIDQVTDDFATRLKVPLDRLEVLVARDTGTGMSLISVTIAPVKKDVKIALQANRDTSNADLSADELAFLLIMLIEEQQQQTPAPTIAPTSTSMLVKGSPANATLAPVNGSIGNSSGVDGQNHFSTTLAAPEPAPVSLFAMLDKSAALPQRTVLRAEDNPPLPPPIETTTTRAPADGDAVGSRDSLASTATDDESWFHAVTIVGFLIVLGLQGLMFSFIYKKLSTRQAVMRPATATAAEEFALRSTDEKAAETTVPVGWDLQHPADMHSEHARRGFVLPDLRGSLRVPSAKVHPTNNPAEEQV